MSTPPEGRPAARAEILRRVAAAQPTTPVAVPRDYDEADGPAGADLVDLLVDRLEDYRATVRRCTPADLPAAVASFLTNASTVVLPPGAPAAWLSALNAGTATTTVEAIKETAAGATNADARGAAGATNADARGAAGASGTDAAGSAAGGGVVSVRDGEPAPLTVVDLDAPGVAVVTGCAVVVAETGTLILDAGPDQGRRLLTLVPDHHVCVVRADQIVARLPAALRRLADPTRPLTMISGPSATSDIELNRVEGVHGPRRLDVVIVS